MTQWPSKAGIRSKEVLLVVGNNFSSNKEGHLLVGHDNSSSSRHQVEAALLSGFLADWSGDGHGSDS